MRLRFTRRALVELEDILEYLATASVQGAERVQKRIQTITALLPERPLAGQRVGPSGLRRVVANPYPYLVFYQVTDDEIIIVGVRHSARDPASMPGR
jgi:toxin ParE1/3/4